MNAHLLLPGNPDTEMESMRTPVATTSSGPPVLRLRVSARYALSERIIALELEAADGMPLPAYEAGAHLAIDCRAASDHANDPAQDGPRLRHYSLCGDPSNPMVYLIAIRRESDGRGGSRFLCDEVRPGDLLHASTPSNLFPVRWPAVGPNSAPTQLLIAGGVGITPLIAMAWALDNAGIAFTLHDFGRSADAHVSAQLSTGTRWRHAVQRHVGRAQDLVTLIGAPEPHRHLYVCGPASMIDAVFETAATLGWPHDHLHTERFTAPTTDGERPGGGPNAEGGHDADGPFVVEIASTGQRIPVTAGESVCTALSRAGVRITVSCEQGVCGACTTRVLSGTPDHRDWVLNADEQATGTVFTPCCSRSRSPLLVLDL